MDPNMKIPSAEEMQMMEAQKAAQEERRAMILDQILEPAAKARIATLALVKKEKARAIEDSLINAASTGRLKNKVNEEQLIAMLQQFSGGSDEGEGHDGKKKGIVVQRRKTGFDDDDDDSDSDLA